MGKALHNRSITANSALQAQGTQKGISFATGVVKMDTQKIDAG